MSKRRRSRIYVKCGRWYGDFRDLGGKLEALIPHGEKRATTDAAVANDLATKRVKALEAKRRGIGLIGIGEEVHYDFYGRFDFAQRGTWNGTAYVGGDLQLCGAYPPRRYSPFQLIQAQ